MTNTNTTEKPNTARGRIEAELRRYRGNGMFRTTDDNGATVEPVVGAGPIRDGVGPLPECGGMPGLIRDRAAMFGLSL